MDITIIGAGAMGTLFTGFLAMGGNNISLLVRTKKAENAIKKNGIKVSGITKTVISPSRLRVTSNPVEIANPDVIIVLVKTYNGLSTVPSIKKMIGKDTVVLNIHNGIGSKFFNGDRIVRGLTFESASFMEYGKVVHTGRGETFIESKKISSKIANEFNRCGIKTKLTDDIESAIWSKLIINCAINPVAAIAGITNGEILKRKNLFEVAVEAGKEAVMVAKKIKIKVMFPDVAEKIKSVCLSTSKNTNSMLADVLSGQQTEIDSINGAVIKIAQKIGVQVSVNRILYKMLSFRNDKS